MQKAVGNLPNDIDGLTSSLRRLVNDRDVRTAYGRAAAQLAGREHDASTNADRIVQTLHCVAANR